MRQGLFVECTLSFYCAPCYSDRMSASRPPLAQAQLTVDVAIFTIADEQLQLLTIRRDQSPFKHSLTLPGGFLWQGETTLQAAERVLRDKAGILDVYIEQLYTFDDPRRDPRGRIISVAYYALVPEHKLSDRHLGRLDTQLVPATELPDMGFDHASITEYALERIRNKLEYTDLAFSLLPTSFTLTQLQRVHEIVLGTPIDKRNFRKKLLSEDIVEETGERTKGQKHRPAKLYRIRIS